MTTAKAVNPARPSLNGGSGCYDVGVAAASASPSNRTSSGPAGVPIASTSMRVAVAVPAVLPGLGTVRLDKFAGVLCGESVSGFVDVDRGADHERAGEGPVFLLPGETMVNPAVRSPLASQTPRLGNPSASTEM